MNFQEYALATFRKSTERPRAGLAIGERVMALEDLLRICPIAGSEHLAAKSILELLQNWDPALEALNNLRAAVTEELVHDRFHEFADVTICPPVDLPHQVFCTGANYRKHVVDLTLDMGVGPEGLDAAGLRRWAEGMMDERAATGDPYVFTKPVSAIAGAYDALVLPAADEKPDWEIEVGVIIGRGGRNISRNEAMSHVAGYAIINDVTSRSLIARTDYKQLGTDWLRAKGQPGFLPFGPVLAPAQFVTNPSHLRLTLSINGKIMQDEAAADMIFDISRQIEYISRYVRLMPGDLICTGSPAGNGTHYNRFLQPGDLMVGEITGLGRQTITCIAA
ncbi:fumarylacetoacetate hydrolase family protein [Bradyrhizobium sp. STM 3561]|uniref:fumarylacetoacetate hydrolase family protein n=1 Tax=unclassified Bradyrhizobium TaxID=2631580 RepID=UPI00388F06C5